jgi:methyl-accepting chemotaxis protein
MNSGARQLNGAIQQLNTVTQQNAAASEEMATSSEELSSQADQLKDLIGYFNTGNEIMVKAKEKKRAVEHKVAHIATKPLPQNKKTTSIDLRMKDDSEFESF